MAVPFGSRRLKSDTEPNVASPSCSRLTRRTGEYRSFMGEIFAKEFDGEI